MTKATRLQRPIPNPVLAPENIPQIKAELCEQRIEGDAWFTHNMGQFLLALRRGTVDSIVARNVAAHMRQVALRRNMI